MKQKEETILYLNQFKNKDAVDVKATYIRLMNSLRKFSYKTLEEYEKKKKLIEDCYDMFRNPKIRKSITKTTTNDEIYDLFLEIKLDDRKRKYDMSELFNPDLIGSKVKDDLAVRTVIEMDKKGKETVLLDSRKRKITIMPIGAVGYDNAFGKRSDCTKYLISKQITGEDVEEYVVYSDINFQLLSSNEEYRKAVTEELLSDRNIKLSNANGYIGKIEPAQEEISTEKLTTEGYSYQISGNYELCYDAEELSAVGIISKDLKAFHKEPLEEENVTLEQFEKEYGIRLKEAEDGER